jgi:hypothetical protein
MFLAFIDRMRRRRRYISEWRSHSTVLRHHAPVSVLLRALADGFTEVDARRIAARVFGLTAAQVQVAIQQRNDYARLWDTTCDPQQVYALCKRDELPVIASIHVLRQVCGLSVGSGKELIHIADCGPDYYERLADGLERAFEQWEREDARSANAAS